MSVDEQKSMSRSILELWGSHNTIQTEDLVTANYVSHQQPSPDSSGASTLKREEWEQLLKDFHEAFSEGSVQILSQIAENDLVASRWEFTATQAGDFRGSASSGKTTTWTGVQTDRYEGGKIAESWVNWDKASFLEGLA